MTSTVAVSLISKWHENIKKIAFTYDITLTRCFYMVSLFYSHSAMWSIHCLKVDKPLGRLAFSKSQGEGRHVHESEKKASVQENPEPPFSRRGANTPPKESRKVPVHLSASQRPNRARQRQANPAEMKALCRQKAEDVPKTWKHHHWKQPKGKHARLEVRRAQEEPGASARNPGAFLPLHLSCSCLHQSPIQKAQLRAGLVSPIPSAAGSGPCGREVCLSCVALWPWSTPPNRRCRQERSDLPCPRLLLSERWL